MNDRKDGLPTDRQPCGRWRAYLPLALITFLGISISLAAFVTVRDWENAHVQADLENRANNHAKSLQQGIGNALEVLQSIRALYAASQDYEVNPAEFRAFAEQALRRHPGIQALEWIPRVPAWERAAYEEAVRQDGYPDFQFTELSAEGKIVAARPREEYFPVYYMAPHQGNERAFGFDLGSNAMRLQALMRARDTGQAVASARIRLVQETGNQNGFLVFVPIYRNGLPHDTPRQRRENLAGFALGVFRIGELIEAVLQSLTTPAGSDIYLYDDSAGPGQRFLYFHPSRLDTQPRRPLAEEEIGAGVNLARTIEVAGREWKILFKPLSTTGGTQQGWQSWGVLAGGLMITVMLATYLLISMRRARETKRLVSEISKTNTVLGSEITERKHAEETLRASEARLAGILDIAPDAVISVDRDQRIRLFNQGAEAIFGHAADETLGRPLDMLLPARLRDVHGRHVEGFARSSATTLLIGERRELVGLKKNGSEFPAEASVSKLQQGGETLFTVMLRDVSERKRTEETLLASEHALQERVADLEEAHRKLEWQAEDLARLADDLLIAGDQARAADRAKSEFLAAMSHELRTPLNAIIGFSEIMANETLGPVGNVRYREYTKDINESGQHLLGLINDILDLSKIESGAEELHEDEIEIPEIIRSSLKLVGQRAEQGAVKLELELSDPLPALRADERKLKQILVNLLSNAIKFSDAGGEVALWVWCRMGSGHVFQIIDTGIGIAPENIPKALSRFGQVDADLNRQYEGTGLGLPLTKALVEQHGGVLDLHSEVGVGTTITVRFPAARIVPSLDDTHSLGVEDREAS